MAKLTAQYDYTDAELLALFREAKAYASQNKEYTIAGKTYRRQDLPDIEAAITKLERRINAAAGKLSVAVSQHGRRA